MDSPDAYNHSTGESAQTRYALPERQKAQTMQETCSDRTGYRSFEIRLQIGGKLLKRSYWRSYQFTDGRLRLESETMAAGHFLVVFPVEKTTKFPNLSMKIQPMKVISLNERKYQIQLLNYNCWVPFSGTTK